MQSEQHVHAMNLHWKEQAQEQGVSAVAYAPIAHHLSDDERRILRIKFDIAYFVSTEQLLFSLKSVNCMESRHGVNIGHSYLHENAGKEFIS